MTDLPEIILRRRRRVPVGRLILFAALPLFLGGCE
jgi:hypothetical protein